MRSDMGDNPELLRQSTHSLLKCGDKDNEEIELETQTPGYEGRKNNVKTNNFVDSDESLGEREPSEHLSDSNKMLEDSCENMF